MLENVGQPDKSYCTVYYTVPFLRYKSYKYTDFRTAKNSSNLPLAFEFLKALVNQEIADWVKEFALKIRFLLS